MKFLRWFVMLILALAVAAAVVGWQKVTQLRSENEALRAELEGFKERTADDGKVQAEQHDNELQQLRAEAKEVFRLRNDVTQLRSAAKEAETMRAQNQQLRTENQQLRSGTGAAATNATNAANSQTGGNQFSRESWTFAGYGTPESALVSSIWAMKEGKPLLYLDSLSPDEQARMARAWESKSEDEVAAKHQQDVSKITALRILDHQDVSPDEVRMNVYIDGVGRTETVSMKRVGNDWKFGGYIRNEQK